MDDDEKSGGGGDEATSGGEGSTYALLKPISFRR